MPSSNSILLSQPIERALFTSRTFLGVPSGLEISKEIFPLVNYFRNDWLIPLFLYLFQYQDSHDYINLHLYKIFVNLIHHIFNHLYHPMQKFSWALGAPYSFFFVVLNRRLESPRNYMRVLFMKVVIRPIKISRHN